MPAGQAKEVNHKLFTLYQLRDSVALVSRCALRPRAWLAVTESLAERRAIWNEHIIPLHRVA